MLHKNKIKTNHDRKNNFTKNNDKNKIQTSNQSLMQGIQFFSRLIFHPNMNLINQQWSLKVFLVNHLKESKIPNKPRIFKPIVLVHDQ